MERNGCGLRLDQGIGKSGEQGPLAWVGLIGTVLCCKARRIQRRHVNGKAGIRANLQRTRRLEANFGDEPLGRVYIDTLSSVSYSFWTSDIDAPLLATVWSGNEEGVKRLRAARRRLAPRW